MDSRLLAKTEASQKLKEINDMVWIAKLTFCGGISRIIFCPMISCLDEKVVWSNLDRYTLTLVGFLALMVYLFRRGRTQKPN